MAKINLTLEQASDLISQMKTAEAGRVSFMERFADAPVSSSNGRLGAIERVCPRTCPI